MSGGEVELRPAIVCPACGQGELDRGSYRGRCEACDCFFAVPPEGLNQEEWAALPARDKWRTSRAGVPVPVVRAALANPSPPDPGVLVEALEEIASYNADEMREWGEENAADMCEIAGKALADFKAKQETKEEAR